MPFRLPPAFHSSTDTSRHWLWLALVTGLLALLLAGAALFQRPAPPTGPAVADVFGPRTTPNQPRTAAF